MTKLEQMQSLQNGKGLQYLVDEAQRILENPIATFDTDYNIIAFSELGVDDRFWNELTTTGTFCRESQMFFMNARFTDEVANAKRLALMQSDELQYDRISGHVFNGKGIKVANVLIMEAYESFDSDMIEAFGYLTELMTEEIKDDEYYIAYGESYQDNWIRRLIDDDIEEKRLYSPHVQILYDGLKENLYLALGEIPKNRNAKELAGCLRSEHRGIKLAIYGDYLVVIISSNYRRFDPKRELFGMEQIFEREKMPLGISSGFDNFFELKKYYAQALAALKIAREKGGAAVVLYDEIAD